MQEFATRTKQTKKEAGGFTEKMDAFARSVRIAEGPLGGTAARLQTFVAVMRQGNPFLTAFVLTMAAVTVGLVVASNILFKFTLQLERLEKRLTAATGSLAGAQLTLERIGDFAQSIGADLSSSALGFSKLAAAARSTNLEGQDVLELFEGVTSAASALSLSVDDTGRAFRALEQIISKGTVQAEELRGQLGEALPGAFQLAASAMEVTTERLGEMLEQGQVISDDFIPRFAKKLKEVFGDLAKRQADSLQGSINRLRNSFFDLGKSLVIVLDLKIAFGDLVGLAERLVRAVNKLATPLQNAGRALAFAESATIGAKFALEIAKPEGGVIGVGRFNELQKVLGEARKRLEAAQADVSKERSEIIDRLSERATGTGLLRDSRTTPKLQKDLARSIELSDELADGIAGVGAAVKALGGLEVVSRGDRFFSPEQIRDSREAIREMNAEVGKSIGTFGSMEDELVDFLVGINKLGPALMQFRDPLGGIDLDLMNLNDSFRDARRAADVSDIFDENKTALEEYREGLNRLAGADAFARVNLSGQKLADTLIVIKREQKRLIEEFAEADPILSKISDAFDSLADGIVEAMTTSENAMTGFRNVAREIVNDILSDFLKLMVIQPLKNALFSAIGPLIGGLGAGGNIAVPGGGGTLQFPAFTPPTAQFGAQFRVGGAGGTDSQLVALRATPGEDITVTNRNRSRAGPNREGGDTIFIDARGADQGQIKRLQDQLFTLNASVETRVLNTVSDRNRRTRKFIGR